jgi:hypothetical protein
VTPAVDCCRRWEHQCPWCPGVLRFQRHRPEVPSKLVSKGVRGGGILVGEKRVIPYDVSKDSRAAVLGFWTRHRQGWVPRVREDDTDVFTWAIAAPAVLLSKLARFQGFGGGDKPKLPPPCRPQATWTA